MLVCLAPNWCKQDAEVKKFLPILTGLKPIFFQFSTNEFLREEVVFFTAIDSFLDHPYFKQTSTHNLCQ